MAEITAAKRSQRSTIEDRFQVADIIKYIYIYIIYNYTTIKADLLCLKVKSDLECVKRCLAKLKSRYYKRNFSVQ